MRFTQEWKIPELLATPKPSCPQLMPLPKQPTYAAFQESINGLRLVCDRELDGSNHGAPGMRGACNGEGKLTVKNQERKITAITL